MKNDAIRQKARYITKYQKKTLKELNRPEKNSPEGKSAVLSCWSTEFSGQLLFITEPYCESSESMGVILTLQNQLICVFFKIHKTSVVVPGSVSFRIN